MNNSYPFLCSNCSIPGWNPVRLQPGPTGVWHGSIYIGLGLRLDSTRTQVGILMFFFGNFCFFHIQSDSTRRPVGLLGLRSEAGRIPRRVLGLLGGRSEASGGRPLTRGDCNVQDETSMFRNRRASSRSWGCKASSGTWWGKRGSWCGGQRWNSISWIIISLSHVI